MEKQFNFTDREKEIYLNWQNNGCFKPLSDKQDNCDAEPYTIVMPPPNVTGQLHMGHALNNTLQDFVIRYERMNGKNCLWVPGTDHASIATEVKVIDMLAKQGITKADLGRDGFLEHAWAWKEKYGSRIIEQLKKIGCSCDWDRLAFTMDKQREKAVLTVFKKLYDDGIIYQGNKIINWCPKCKTALSDAEVDHEDVDSNFWYIKYPFVDNEIDGLIIATTRPETLFGDVAVAVNPLDERFTKLVGKKLKLPLTNREIPIIADEYVEKDFGTGAVKITPAHDPNDFEVGARHNLEIIKVMNDDGTMNSLAGEKFNGMDRFECRKVMIEDLQKQGLLVKIEPHVVSRGQCYRCKTAVEPIISKQWFVSMKKFGENAAEAVKSGELNITPKRVERIYLNWIENIRDWCISRQLWWGHRIPVYTCQDCGNIMCETSAPSKCSKCGSKNLKQDEDVLDTWFSSALWPFSVLGWPDKTDDLKRFYPTSTLITGQDIIFFWVARMVMMSQYAFDGKLPFKNVVINGIVRDDEGKKMSKSSNNGVDPVELIDTFGADALRFSLLIGNGSGNDFRFSYDKITEDRKFLNKVWNASKLVEMCAQQTEIEEIDKSKLNCIEKWIMFKFNQAIDQINKQMQAFDFCLAVKTMYDFVWDDFCDWYLEMIKPYVYSNDESVRSHSTSVLVHLLIELLKMLAPIIPFITEEIYSNFTEGFLMDQPYSNVKIGKDYAKCSEEVEQLIEIIRKIREFRTSSNVPLAKKIKLIIDKKALYSAKNVEIFEKFEEVIKKMANISEIIFEIDSNSEYEHVITSVGNLFMLKSEVFDYEKEKERLTKELAKIEAEIVVSESKFNNENFMARAPQKVIEEEKARYDKNMLLKTAILNKLK